MSAPLGTSLKPSQRPSTPATTTPASQNATPRSYAVPGLANNSPSHTRTPSGSRIDTRSPGHTPGVAVAAAAMQRTGSSKAFGMSSPLSGASQSHRTLGTPRMGIGGKTVPGTSSAGKSLPIGNAPPRQDALGGISNFGPMNGSPPVGRASPGLSSLGNNLNGLQGFDSPGLAALTGGIDMSLSLSNLSNLPLGASLSNLGSTGGGKLSDEDQRLRLEGVLDIVRQRPGRISREAIERLGRRCEMDIMREGDDKVSLAGKNSVLIDLQYTPNRSSRVERVSVLFPTASEELSAHSDKASKIMLQDLTPSENTASINATLNTFANNLERLACMDKLSVEETKTNCFEAVFGVYKSLKKLYDQEREAAEKFLTGDGRLGRIGADSEVMCKRSGRPKMHARRRVGLSLEYWKDHLHVADQRDVGQDEDAMEVDDDTPDELIPEEEDDIKSLTIECEYCPPALYQPIRTPGSWISDRVITVPDETMAEAQKSESQAQEQQQQQSKPRIEWLEPPSLFQPVMNEDGTTLPMRPPHARFVAHLEPPIAVPAQVATQLYANVDVDINNLTDQLVIAPFINLTLSESTPLHYNTNSASTPQSTTISRPVLVPPTPGPTGTKTDEREEVFTLNLIPTRISTDPGVSITKLPFSHPRQLIAILPILRQYSLLSKILRTSFTTSETATNPLGSASTSTEILLPGEVAEQDNKGEGENEDEDENEDEEAMLSAFQSTPSRLKNIIDISMGMDDPHFSIADEEEQTYAQDQLTSPSLHLPKPYLDLIFPISVPKTAANEAGDKLKQVAKDEEEEEADYDDDDADEEGVKHIRLFVLENGRIKIAENDLFPSKSEPKSTHEKATDDSPQTSIREKERNVARGLEVSEDLAIWVSWLRTKLQQQHQLEVQISPEMKNESDEHDAPIDNANADVTVNADAENEDTSMDTQTQSQTALNTEPKLNATQTSISESESESSDADDDDDDRKMKMKMKMRR